MTEVGSEFLRRLIDEHWPPLVLYARQWSNDAEDVVQEAILRLMRQHKLPDDPVAWLYRVVRNQAISSIRGKHRRERREQATAQSETWFDNGDSNLDARAAADALQKLPADTREVILMRIWSGLKLHEIAAIQRTSIATIHRRYEQGISMLRDLLGER